MTFPYPFLRKALIFLLFNSIALDPSETASEINIHVMVNLGGDW